MKGARFTWCSGLASLAVAALAFGGPAQAADFGGDCCADLEERIAELEATTVRKGNRKVSVTITGWVSAMVMYWDDGEEQNVYVVNDSTDLGTNFSITGTAQITSDWSAGYLINVFTDGPNAFLVTQSDSDANLGVSIERSFWFLQSKTYGKLTVGKQSATGDNAAILTDFTGTLFQANNVTFEGVFFNLRGEGATGGALSSGFWGQLLHCNSINLGIGLDCNGLRNNAVRYDTPTFGGFSASVSFGEDDVWEYALKFANESNGWKVSAAVGYGLTNGNGLTDINGAPVDTEFLQVGVTLKHLQSGLWVHTTYGQEDTDNAVVSDGQAWYIKAGWSPKLNALGTTHFYGEYRKNDDTYGAFGFAGAATACATFGQAGTAIAVDCAVDAGLGITGSEVIGYGAGIVQEIDAASMNIWAKYRHYEAEIDYSGVGVSGTQEFDDLDLFMVGALLFF